MADENAPWSWRRASGGIAPPPYDFETFHAYDVNNSAACEPLIGLTASRDEPNEGSRICPNCVEVVKAEPWGREPRMAVRG